MPTDVIRYDLQVQDALRGVVRKVLAETGDEGRAIRTANAVVARLRRGRGEG